MNFSSSKENFDIVIIGAGGAGLMAALSAIEAGAKKIAVISKVALGSSHTVAAKGGINASLGNQGEDDWRWHAYDTLKGADFLADVDAVELLSSKACEAIKNLEKIGVVFSRNQNGEIAQRAYGGQTTNFGNGEVAMRACYSKDKTGQTILHSLQEQALKNGVKFFLEFFVTDLLVDEEKRCHGCLALDLGEGKMVLFESKITILATGGYSQIYRNTTSSLICTGDGSALVLKEGLPLQDMEFVQFHPTGIFGQGFLITEAARGEGGHLLNFQGERFMQNYAPKMMELASRDVVSQAMAREIYEGRGCGAEKKYLHLDLRHLSDEVLSSKLPGVVDLVKNFARLDVKKDLIPVAPSAHYSMGGVPCDLDCFVSEGLMAIGEAACVSVHGANRLGCNSLLDLIVFGEIAGKKAAEKISQKFSLRASEIGQKKLEELQQILSPTRSGCEFSLASFKMKLQEINEKYLGVFREEKLLEQGMASLQALQVHLKNYRFKNRNLLWNEELTAYFEIENLLLNSLAANFAALQRKESRGAHYRSDFVNRDDEKFLAHSLVKMNKNEFQFSLKPIKNSSKIPELNIPLGPRKY